MRPVLDVVPPKWALIYLLMAMLLHLVWLLVGGFHLALPALGMLGLVLGFGVMTWGWALFRSRGTAVHPFDPSTVLVQEGPYRFTRNPMYLGMTLILTGIAFFSGTPPAFFAPLAFYFTISRRFIPYEEKKMEETFGKSYLDYKRRVRRWL